MLIISDVEMPDMDGYQMCRSLKDDNTTRHIPIILLTSLAQPTDVIQALEVSADSYLTKPYDENLLLSKIKYFLSVYNEAGKEHRIETVTGEYAGKQFHVTASPQQILNLLLTVYDNSIRQNQELVRTKSELARSNQQLQQKLNELQNSEYNFRTVVSTIPDIIYRIDKAGRFTLTKEAIQKLGYHPDDLIGKHFSTIIADKYLDCVSRDKV